MRFWWWGGLLIILLDQASKSLVEYLYWPIVYNEKYFGGVLEAADWLVFLILLILIFYLRREKENLNLATKIGWQLIVSGGISNLIDRLARGRVVDFINWGILPNFNLADAFIVLGLFLIVFPKTEHRFAKKACGKGKEINVNAKNCL